MINAIIIDDVKCDRWLRVMKCNSDFLLLRFPFLCNADALSMRWKLDGDDLMTWMTILWMESGLVASGIGYEFSWNFYEWKTCIKWEYEFRWNKDVIKMMIDDHSNDDLWMQSDLVVFGIGYEFIWMENLYWMEICIPLKLSDDLNDGWWWFCRWKVPWLHLE